MAGWSSWGGPCGAATEEKEACSARADGVQEGQGVEQQRGNAKQQNKKNQKKKKKNKGNR